MDLSPDTLRQVEFREQWRGYNQDEVDDLLERVAVAVGELQGQVASALERAAQAESRLLESSPSEDELRRTLVLAQRTAEAARREAEDEAARTLASAREEADRLVHDAGERARAIDEEARRAARTELDSLVKARDALAADVEALRRHLEEQRSRLRADAQRLLEDLDRPDVLTVAEAPPVSDVDVPAPPPEPAPVDGDVDVDAAAVDVDAEETAGEIELGLELQADEALDTAGARDEQPLDGDEATAAPAPAAFDDAYEEPAGVDDTGEIAAAEAALLEAEARKDMEHAMEHDPFLAELRRAVTDTEPLGPREEDESGEAGSEDGIAELYDQDLGPSSRFRLRRRR